MKNCKKVLGLDIGSNSIGFSLLELNEKDNKITFNELVSNSIIFSEPDTAEDRRNARSARRRNERKSTRNRYARKIFVKYNISKEDFIENTTNYLNSLLISDSDVYNIREKAILGEKLTKDDFIFCTYSILTDRGYSNMFSVSKEDGVINEPVVKNKEEYEGKNYLLPSSVLTLKRKTLENIYQNTPIRNKKNDYKNSLGRDLHKEEFIKVVLSQANNTDLFSSSQQCAEFIDEITNESIINAPFFQRPLKSFESMVEYCALYDKFNPKGSYKKAPLANIKNIELTLRQAIDNYPIIHSKTGEIKKLTKEEINSIINFWINTPSSNEITSKNIFKSIGFKETNLSIPEKSSQLILNIQAHRQLLEILTKYNIDFQNKNNDFYNKLLLELHYFKNTSSRVQHIKSLIKISKLSLSEEFIQKVVVLENMDGFASFSLKFINEVLDVIRTTEKTHHEALEFLGYYSKYINMPIYDYLPPLEPTKKDIKWLKENIAYFETKHLFYQPIVSPKVKRVLSVLRKLINEIISKYGQIDEIRIETAKEMNSKKEKEKIDKNQSNDRVKNNEAEKFLKDNDIAKSKKNIEIAKLFKEQGAICLYSGDTITKDEAFDNEQTEVEHFIPRSVIWINSYKNKILVKKKYNQNKGSSHPVSYLKSIGQWENFQGRVEKLFMVFNKKDWLTKEDIINSVMQKDQWKDSYLNDTRSATKTIQKYLNHYLYPKKTIYGKDEKRSIFSVSGRAVNELKHMWGIHKVMPKNKDDKKDRNTNYHHTLDAFIVALCSNTAINTLHNHFIKKENKFKTRALKENLSLNKPTSKDGINIVEYLKKLVQKYENNKLYVCPLNKRKTNAKGFKDGNLKLYITKDQKNNEILAEMEKVAIDESILIKTVGGFPKPRSDAEVKDEIQSIQNRLNPVKQKKIIKAIEIYANGLIKYRSKLSDIDNKIKELKKNFKTGKQHKEFNDVINKDIAPLQEEKNMLSKQMQDLKCSFLVKNNKQQIVKSLNLYKTKVEQSKADAIIYTRRNKNKIQRLSLLNFKQAIKDKEPFVAKMNESTLNVELFNTQKRGQAVGLNYFSSIKNDIKTKVNDRYLDEISEAKSDMILHKNDLIKVIYIKNGKQECYLFNGGGDITGSNNKLAIKNINLNTFTKTDKKGNTKEVKEDRISPGVKTIVKKINIDFFGNIIEV